jgi:hypothetical protein
LGLSLGLSVRSRCRWLVMTISTRSLLLPRPAPGRRGGRRRATGQPRTQRRAAPVRPERQRRTARRAQSSFRKFVVSRLRLAGSGLYGSAAHRAARGPTKNRPAARPAPQICLLRVSARTRRCGDAGTNTLLQTGRTAMARYVCARDRSRRPRSRSRAGPHAKRIAGGARSRQELPNPLCQTGVIQTHRPFQQGLSDSRRQHAVERQAIENKRPVGLKPRNREIGKQPHIVPTPDPFQRRNENLFFKPGPAQKNDASIRCYQ